MQKAIKRAGVLLLCLLLVFLALASAYLETSHAGHQCLQDRCSVCVLVRTNALLRRLASIRLLVFAAACMLLFRFAFFKAPEWGVDLSLVSLKIKLTC